MRPRGGAGGRRRGRRPRASIRQRRDDRRVVGGLRPLALVAVDLDGVAARGERGRQQDVVDSEPPAAVEGAGAVVPPGEETALLTVKPATRATRRRRWASSPSSGSRRAIASAPARARTATPL